MSVLKKIYLSLRCMVAPLVIGFKLQLQRCHGSTSLCVCACLCLLDHIYGEQFENNRRREQTHRAEQREPVEGASWLKPSPHLQPR